jgi:xanthine dehydrogenase accessory factor
LGRCLDEGSGVTEVVVFDEAAAEFTAPSSYLIDSQGELVARLAAEDPPAWVLQTVQPLEQRPRAAVRRGVAFLPSLPRSRLLIVGAGHVGLAVARLADEVDFDVWIADDRADIASAERFPMARRLLTGSLEQTLPAAPIDNNTYCLIVTRGHQHDERALYLVCQRGARYVGLIGSRRKIRMIFEDLLNEGVPAEALSRVYAPLGIEIGSRTVPEIAVSICAELIAHRNLGHVPGRPAAIDPLAPHGPTRGCEAEV